MIVIDTNVLIAALIRDSSVRMLIVHSKHLLYPKRMLKEIHRHRSMIQRKACITAEELDRLLSCLLRPIRLIEFPTLNRTYDEAYRIVKDIDPDDAQLFACALAFPGSVIWSDDKALKRQKAVSVLSTTELLSQSL